MEDDTSAWITTHSRRLALLHGGNGCEQIPNSHMDNLLDELHGLTIFTGLDLSNACRGQVPRHAIQVKKCSYDIPGAHELHIGVLPLKVNGFF